VSKLLKLLIGAFAVLVLVAGGLVAYVVFRDSAEEQANLGAIGTGPTAPGADRDSADGTWTVQPDETVFVGYRVHEILRGADKEVTGRTKDVTGTMTIAGNTVTEAEFTADMTGLTTDDPLRDNAIRTRGPETERFPEATLKLSSPLELPSAPVKGQQISVTAKADLTLHGVTRTIDLPLQAQWDGGQIRVATTGNGARIQFQDFGFGALEVPVARTDDFGFLEVQLLFVPGEGAGSGSGGPTTTAASGTGGYGY
jgi:polyisoprenoid-binding protein YceI